MRSKAPRPTYRISIDPPSPILSAIAKLQPSYGSLSSARAAESKAWKLLGKHAPGQCKGIKISEHRAK